MAVLDALVLHKTWSDDNYRVKKDSMVVTVEKDEVNLYRMTDPADRIILTREDWESIVQFLADQFPPTIHLESPFNEILDPEVEYLNYDEWITTQPWPIKAKYVTCDWFGGCCWWSRKPNLDATSEYGWAGYLVERYYDSSTPFNAIVLYQKSLFSLHELKKAGAVG